MCHKNLVPENLGPEDFPSAVARPLKRIIEIFLYILIELEEFYLMLLSKLKNYLKFETEA